MEKRFRLRLILPICPAEFENGLTDMNLLFSRLRLLTAAVMIVTGVAAIGMSQAAFAQTTGAIQTPNADVHDSGHNPTASSVNEETLFKTESKLHGFVSIPDVKSANLEQPMGRIWRRYHESYLPWIGGVAILGMIFGLAAFYFLKGTIGADEEFSGPKILRFNDLERGAHWLTATCFILLALSGVNYVFGKRILQPLIGPDAFTVMSQYLKYAHNFLSWPFMLGVTTLFLLWVKDNIPNRVDVQWIMAGGGVFSKDGHAHADRFNAGQKGVFWIVVLGGFAMSLTGLCLIFPFYVTDVTGMQLAETIHGLFGMLYIAGLIAHIYIGTIGMKGAFEAMGTGEVDIAWAKVHHDLWVERELAQGKGPSTPAPSPAE
jgi:formate dehydrogenase subunit gamma